MSGNSAKSRPVRLFVSLAVSLGLHAALLAIMPGLSAWPQAEARHPASPLAVQLLPAETNARTVMTAVKPPVADKAVIPSAQPASPPTEPKVRSSDSQAGNVTPGAEPATAPSGMFPGPWYYPARYLHRRPTPLKPIWPDYPDSLEAVRGHVRILLLINEEGVVDQYRIQASAPPDAFDASVIAAFTAARYAPALIAGYQVKSQLLAEVSFEPGAPPRADFSIMESGQPLQLPASSLGREN